jgi:hypothetical protein
MMKLKILSASLCLLLHFSAVSQSSENFQTLVDWMTGEFDSSEQAAKDDSYFNITLKMTRIWPDMPNGAWIYVEQAVADSQDKPYRQRVYFLSENEEDEFTSDVYTLKNDSIFIGAWKDPSVFDAYKPFDLNYKDGCTVFLFYDGFQFGGETNEGSCKSDLRGASYATSRVIVLEDRLQSWDQGFDKDGNQVWGAEKGPYIFQRKK